jgi:hypothetical protein
MIDYRYQHRAMVHAVGVSNHLFACWFPPNVFSIEVFETRTSVFAFNCDLLSRAFSVVVSASYIRIQKQLMQFNNLVSRSTADNPCVE